MSFKIRMDWRRWLGIGLCLTVAGCVGWDQRRNTQATSVLQFLYPNDPTRIEAQAIPQLALPLRVGVAFVPPGDASAGRYGYTSERSLTEKQKTELLRKVADRFKGLPYVGKIEVIPGAYLRPGGGFDNLAQVRTMFGVDVIALVAYDQVQFTDANFLSLAYWTIVGAYVVQGQHNDTQTLMDAVVYDIASRQMLFRAPGASQVKAHATPVALEAELRADSGRGFALATEEMVKNLEAELGAFRQRIKERPEQVKIVHRPGYTGAGAYEGWLAMGLVAAVVLAGRRKAP